MRTHGINRVADVYHVSHIHAVTQYIIHPTLRVEQSRERSRTSFMSASFQVLFLIFMGLAGGDDTTYTLHVGCAHIERKRRVRRRSIQEKIPGGGTYSALVTCTKRIPPLLQRRESIQLPPPSSPPVLSPVAQIFPIHLAEGLGAVKGI